MGTPPQWPDPPQQEPTPQNPQPNPPTPAIWQRIRSWFAKPKDRCAMCDGFGKYPLFGQWRWCNFCEGTGWE